MYIFLISMSLTKIICNLKQQKECVTKSSSQECYTNTICARKRKITFVIHWWQKKNIFNPLLANNLLLHESLSWFVYINVCNITFWTFIY